MSTNLLALGISSQMLAGIYTLKDCIDRCPENEWHEKHNDYPFSQVVFHVLFDCDLNLSSDIMELKKQEFHQINKNIFDDYEELEEKSRIHLYEREFIRRYYKYCVEKIKQVIELKNSDDLLIPNSDIYKNMTKSERYINAIRHIQHHSAQLGLRIQYINGQEMDWISKGNGK